MIEAPESVGVMLGQWRRRRGFTQMELAAAAQTSARHISFIETGRASPGGDVLSRVMRALEVPAHDAAILRRMSRAPANDEQGGAPDADALAALALILETQEPSGSVAINARWDIVMVNETYARFLRQHPVGASVEPLMPLAQRLNIVRLMLAPDGLRCFIVNWSEVARAALGRVRITLAAGAGDSTATTMLLRDLLRDTDVSRLWAEVDVDAAPALVAETIVRVGDETIRTKSTIVTLGSSEHEWLRGVRIETFHRV